MARRSFYVTTPIYYVNAAPHLGHAYTTIAADVMARHHRQRGEDVFFLTGTDEHGEPVSLAAEREGVSPQELADRNAERFKALAPRARRHQRLLHPHQRRRPRRARREVLKRVKDNGHVYEGDYEGWYCPRCADFKSESEIAEGNTCPIHKIPLIREHEHNWFFRLSSFQEPLEQLFTERPDFVQPRSRYNEALAFIRGGLQDVSLSRAKLEWGIRVPWDDSQVVYVWWDALLNYYTALGYARDGEDLTDDVLAGDLPPDRQGHPQVPHRLLAGAADGRRPAGPRARLRPRLPADGGREDEQVARQRARPVRGHRPLRRRRAALLPAARRLVRTGRLGLRGGVRGALRERARQRLRQPREPHDRDDRALSRRRRAGGRPRSAARGRLRRARRARRGADRRGRGHAGARRDLAARAAHEPLRRGARAVEAREGRVDGRRARRRARVAGRGDPRAHGAAAPVAPGDVREAARGARPARARLRARAARGGAAGAGHEDRGPVPEAAASRRGARRDRQPHPPRLLRAPERRAGRTRARGRRAADPDRRHGSRELPHRARGRRELRRGLRRHRPPPEQRRRLLGRRPRGPRTARRARALRGDRRDRPRLLPRPRAARGSGACLPRADRARARRPASRS